MVDGWDNVWRSSAPGPHTHGNTARQAVDGLWTEARGQQRQSNDPGSANAETTPARALAAAADRKQQPNATCEGKHGKELTGDCPGPCKETTTRRNVTQGGGRGSWHGAGSVGEVRHRMADPT